ncbi:MAG: ABC transporter permease [Desulfomonile sp.]|nr:ABC transporter permease [Desulfomonile sp.]
MFDQVKLRDFIPMCWRLVLRNRRRYKAVIAAIALGTVGFIIIRTMGDSVETKLGENLELLGEATVLRAEWDNHEENQHPGQYYQRDVTRLKQIPNVIAVAPVVSLTRCQATAGTAEWNPRLTGVDHAFWKTQTPHLERGRLISASDVVGRRNVCVLGQEVAQYLFKDKDPVGQVIKIGHHSFKVIGTLGGIQHTDIRSAVFIPITKAQSGFQGLNWISEIYMRADNWHNVEAVHDSARDILTSGHKGYESGIKLIHYPERVKRVKTMVYIVKIFIYASLVVVFILGKVGLTNVMLAAIQDRTREIGLRKALGARDGMIRMQFLTEAVMISLVSGILGVIGGLAAVQALKGSLGVEVSAYVMSTSILMDLAFTVMIGVFAGMYPSAQASRLDVVTAMRFE